MEYQDLKLRRVVNMAVAGVPTSQICHVMQITEEDFDKLSRTDDYKELYEEALKSEIEKDEQFKTLNDAWDQLEALSLTRLINTIEWSQDTDLALKVAAVANKANRKSALHARPIDATNTASATVKLNSVFIQQLTKNYVIDGDKQVEVGNMDQKRVDYMPANNVQKLLASDNEEVVQKKKSRNMLKEMFSDLNDFAIAE